MENEQTNRIIKELISRLENGDFHNFEMEYNNLCFLISVEQQEAANAI